MTNTSAPEGEVASLIKEVEDAMVSPDTIEKLRQERASIEEAIDSILARIRIRVLSPDEEVYVIKTVERWQGRLDEIAAELRLTLDLAIDLRVAKLLSAA